MKKLPAISKIRFTNIIYENGGKRFNDEIFEFDGHNGVILLENGGGKTVIIQTALQAILPHTNLGERKIRDTLSLESGAGHIAIEWILNDRPRRYGVTAVSLYLAPEGIKSLRYAYEYTAGDDHAIEHIPFVKKGQEGLMRSTSRQEIQEYYQYMNGQKLNAHTFDTIKSFQEYIEENFHIIHSEWKNISLINGAEGDVEKFFEQCKTTSQLIDKLLIPIVEEALVGKGTDDFVNMFEKQREHFKTHRELRSRISQSQEIEKRIGHYVSTYSIYDEMKNHIRNKRGQAKSLYKFIAGEEDKARKEIENMEDAQEILNEENQELERKKLSYELAKINEVLKQNKENYEIILYEYKRIKGNLEAKEKRLEELEIAEIRLAIKEEEERIIRLTKEINQLDADYETMDLKDRLDENSSILKGYFQNKLNNLEKETTKTSIQADKYEEELKLTLIKSEDLEKERESLIKDGAGLETEINIKKNIMEDIKKEILSNPTNEKVEIEYPKWRNRLEEIERINQGHRDHIRSLKNRKNLLLNEIPGINRQVRNLIKDATLSERNLQEIHSQHEGMLAMIRILRPGWKNFDSIYLKQESIVQYMEEKLETIKDERERLLEDERLSYRFLDYYGNNKYFIGEPLLESWVDSWKNQFNLLELGSGYIEKISNEFDQDIDSLYKAYPLWTLAIITSDSEVNKLYNKIEEEKEKLISPIIVLSQEEASRIVLGRINIEERYVYPAIWQKNIHRPSFEKWKEELLISANEIVEERKNKEIQENDWHEKLKKIKEFLIDYPYERYNQLKEDQEKSQKRLEDSKELLMTKEVESENIGEEIEQYEIKLKNLEDESNYLEKNIAGALDYFKRDKEIDRVYMQLYKKKEEINKLDKDILVNKNEIEGNKDMIESTKEEIRSLNTQISRILSDDNYKEVKDLQSLYRDISKINILEDRNYIKSMLAEKQKDRPELESKLKKAGQNKEERIRSLELKYKFTKYKINDNIKYPYNGREEINNLAEALIRLRKERKKVQPLKVEKEEKLNESNYEYGLREKDFLKKFNHIINFMDPLPAVDKQIKAEKIEIEEREKYIRTNMKRLEKELKDIGENLQRLKIEDGKYEFLSDRIEGKLLEADKIQNLPYNRNGILTNLIDEMQELKLKIEKQLEKVNMEKAHFIQFLNENPIEIRLKEMAISGVKNKKDFVQLLEWQKNMSKTLNRVIKIHEKHMMEHDRELNQFIQYLYTHLSDLAYEIGTISKNTKVKIDDKWREIYQIQVPSWNEDRGKEEIRKHVDWIVKQLNEDSFLDEEGKEDISKVRKAIETWLQPKQLLNTIMLGQEIKVKCRKVTNDGKVSSTYYSWNSSNQWSGGEKWSKNMALFLGILNYSAEKRQHIIASQKRNRTVIMDNPFGKASSDHVLNPVFFIAEQLGFQFIVLTAHGDGRYIRDYFPIVYSCKLRPTVKGDSSILTKEKIINHAFFRDNDPMTIERIGDKEQFRLKT